MMKKLFTIIGFFCAAQLFAQATFSITPLNPQASYGPDADDPKAENTIVNLTSVAKNIRWERTIINLTADCETYVCDPLYCYGPGSSVKTFPLPANGSGNISVHLLIPDAISATTVVRLKYYDELIPADSIIAIYTVSTVVSGTEEEAAAARIKLYPNPTVESFTLENADMVSAIRIFSLDGRQVSRMEAEPSQVYSLAGQPTGSYIIVMENQKGPATEAEWQALK